MNTNDDALRSTVIATAPAAMAAPTDECRGAGVDRQMLIEHYQAIVRARAIYYPVPYRLGHELGRGRQGIVFNAFRHGARGCVTQHAIKLFDPAIYGTPCDYWTDMGRIADQITRLQRVNSPHLIGRDSYEENNGIGFIQMEAIDGLNGEELLYGRHFEVAQSRSTPAEWAQFNDVMFRRDRGGRVSIQPGVALYVVRKALRGLEVLHAAGFLHCDVKPANIMVDRIGVTRVVDYGRAVRMNERTNFLFGTPMYMAPEVHRREPNLVQSDIYGLGLVLLELLRGEPLLRGAGADEKALLGFKLQLPARLMDLLPPHVRANKDLVEMLRRFVDPDPAKRFADAEQAESVNGGLAMVHKQLTVMGIDSQYDRDLENYISKLFPDTGPAPRFDAVLG